VVHTQYVNGAVSERTHYVGSVEVVHRNGGREFRRSIGGVALATFFEGTQVEQVRYLHRDHLGSTVAISDETGQVVQRMGFDPWGQRRTASPWWPYQSIPAGQLAAIRAITPRGYTGHEHLDSLGIVHMNGRIYDPRLARFLQADPLIEDGSTLNRYTYVHNDPLAWTDPSGYWGRREQNALRTVVADVRRVPLKAKRMFGM
jgi:RHS repeat-associated protein